MKSSIRHHLFLLALAVSSMIFVAALYGYMHNEVHASVEQAIIARDTVSVEAADKTQDQNLLQTYSATAPDRAQIESLFIPVPAEVSFIEAVESVGSSTGIAVSLSSIDADDLSAAAPGTLGSIRGQVSAHGSWPAVMRTLILAETLPYAVTVTDVSLDAGPTAGQGASAKTDWSLSFKIQAELIASSTSPQPTP